MARVKGAEGTINQGAIGDYPVEEDAENDRYKEQNRGYYDSIERGEVELLNPFDDPGKTELQIANAIVRGDELNDPVEAAKASVLEDRAHDIVLTDDVRAKKGDAQPELDEDDPRHRAPSTGRVRAAADNTLGSVGKANAESYDGKDHAAGRTADDGKGRSVAKVKRPSGGASAVHADKHGDQSEGLTVGGGTPKTKDESKKDDGK